MLSTYVIADLTGNATLNASAIADYQIYHYSGFNFGGSDPGPLDEKGRLRADVEVYAPSTTVTGVTISSNTAALGGDGNISLTQSGKFWQSTTDGICGDHNVEVAYTITTALAYGSTVVARQISPNHSNVPDAKTIVNSLVTSNEINELDFLADKRPTYIWEAPEIKLAEITTAPADRKMKYTYEFSHVDKTATQMALLSICNSVIAAGSQVLYEVDSFIPAVDCDPHACATKTGVNAENISCRMNIETFLMDESDRFPGQVSGHFLVFCADPDGDGNCG